jgi:hypothetical protein
MFEILPLRATAKQSADNPKAMIKTDRKSPLITSSIINQYLEDYPSVEKIRVTI